MERPEPRGVVAAQASARYETIGNTITTKAEFLPLWKNLVSWNDDDNCIVFYVVSWVPKIAASYLEIIRHHVAIALTARCSSVHPSDKNFLTSCTKFPRITPFWSPIVKMIDLVMQIIGRTLSIKVGIPPLSVPYVSLQTWP
jgi:hypothetical protein